MRRAPRRLAFHRETLRSLADRTLGDVAGGTVRCPISVLLNCDGTHQSNNGRCMTPVCNAGN
jgi:hypothetical protein